MVVTFDDGVNLIMGPGLETPCDDIVNVNVRPYCGAGVRMRGPGTGTMWVIEYRTTDGERFSSSLSSIQTNFGVVDNVED